ncbi:O-antigen ligase domain-containing protein [Poriferisphaera sp. WC338]|uniref:O-antigen ligase domain-containing protein n=1 Tax=Poriferisphaera sp. WC338 TaxID=3425129 RepID=UPI003D813477
MLVFDSARVTKFRVSLWDVPMLMWCMSPMLSSLNNGLGAYDGLSGMLTEILTWGVPYFIGRVYLTTPEVAQDMVRIIFIATLVYLPLVWFEMVLSPQLHRIVYGSHAHQFIHAIRGGGYRPRVFMRSGLALGIWMAGATMCGIVLWHCRIIKEVRSVPMLWCLIVLGLTFIFCKAVGALLLGVAAIGLFFSTIWLRSKAWLMVVLAVMPIYLTARVAYDWDAKWLLDQAREVFPEKRVESLGTRINNENALRDKAMQRPLFGWGGFGRSRIVNDQGEQISITDSAWIIVLGRNGVFGLLGYFGVLLVPLLRLAYHVPLSTWRHPVIAPSVALALILGIFMIDRLLNAQLNPIPIFIAGGLVGMPWSRIQSVIRIRGLQQVYMQQRMSKPESDQSYPQAG